MKNRAWLRLLTVLLVLGLAGFGVYQILQTDPAPRKKKPPALDPLVRVLQVEPADHPLLISAYGNVRTADELTIRPQVGGQLLQLHPAFEPGGVIPANQPLFKIDPTDYEFQVSAAEATLAKEQADLEIEQGKRKVAAEELRLLEGSVRLDRSSRSLALRTPQLKQVRARLRLAQNQLEQAKLELSRTQTSLPYDVVVLSRKKVPGEVLAARDAIGSVARADRFWVELQIPSDRLARLRTRTAETTGAKVKVQHRGVTYSAQLTRILPALSDGSRLAGALAEVIDPLGKLPTNQGRPPLLVGSYVKAQIEGGVLRNTLAVPRSVLHDNQRIWLVDAKDRLQVRTVEPAFIGEEKVYLQPLNDGERILFGNTNGLIPGSKVRIQQ